MRESLELSKPTRLADVEAWVKTARAAGATGGSAVAFGYQSAEVTIHERDDSTD